jgi:hypothetical protein
MIRRLNRGLSSLRILLLVLAACSVCPLFAQEEAETIRATLRGLAWERTIKDLYLRSAGEYKRMVIPSGGLSLEYEYEGPAELRFFRKGPEGPEGRPTWLPATPPRTLSNGTNYLFVFREDTGQPENYAVAMHESDPTGFPAGAYRFFNFSRHPLACRLGPIEFSVPPGGSRIVPMNPPAENHFVTFLAHEVEGQWELLFKTKWAWYPNKRSYVFVSPDPESGEVSLKIIEENMGWR